MSECPRPDWRKDNTVIAQGWTREQALARLLDRVLILVLMEQPDFLDAYPLGLQALALIDEVMNEGPNGLITATLHNKLVELGWHEGDNND